MAQYARTRGMDGFVIAIHPRHAKYYKSFLCFEEIGGVVNYPLVRNRLSSPLQFGEFFDHQYDEDAKEWAHSGAMSQSEVAHFQQFVEVPMPSLASGITLSGMAVPATN